MRQNGSFGRRPLLWRSTRLGSDPRDEDLAAIERCYGIYDVEDART
jgi:hypothetical protein